jgi:uncharacterized protein
LRSENLEEMGLLKKYDIELSKLNLGQYDFSFQIDDEFFSLFDFSLIDKGSLKADIVLDKKTTFISMIFRISGTIQLICDRSLDEFDYELKTEDEIILNFGDEPMGFSDEIEVIPSSTQQITVAKYIYELISVGIPMKKMHPRYADEPNEDQLIFSSDDEDEKEESSDPRWSELKKLKNNSKN